MRAWKGADPHSAFAKGAVLTSNRPPDLASAVATQDVFTASCHSYVYSSSNDRNACHPSFASGLFPPPSTKKPLKLSRSTSGRYLSCFSLFSSALCTHWPPHQHHCPCTQLWTSLPSVFYSLSKHSHKGFVLLSRMSSRQRFLLALLGR